MAAKHGTRRRYNEGCRCDECKDANTVYQQRYRQRPTVVVPLSAPVTPPSSFGPGPVEAGVEAEIAGLAEARPGLAAAALALARILDNPRAISSQPPAARMLATLLDKLRSASAGRHLGRLATTLRLPEFARQGPAARQMPRHPPAGGICHRHTP
jgi:hypothetical protein